MIYLDVCAGISASTVAWKPLGWEAAAYSEIEAAPRALLSLPYPKAIENPARSFIGTAIRSPDQTIHPHQFGDDASKATGLWLDRLPRIRPTAFAKPRAHPAHGTDLLGDPIVGRWSNQTDAGQNNLSPGEDRWLERSGYRGVACPVRFGAHPEHSDSVEA